MRALSDGSQSQEVSSMAPLAALLVRDVLPSRDLLAQLDGYTLPGKATAPRRRRFRSQRVSLACERGQATVTGLGCALVGSVFVGVFLYELLTPTIARVLEVL
jgi:hypothetical protein